jgi:hypothetical protein
MDVTNKEYLRKVMISLVETFRSIETETGDNIDKSSI